MCVCGVGGGGGARVSELFYKDSKSKKKTYILFVSLFFFVLFFFVFCLFVFFGVGRRGG